MYVKRARFCSFVPFFLVKINNKPNLVLLLLLFCKRSINNFLMGWCVTKKQDVLEIIREVLGIIQDRNRGSLNNFKHNNKM